MTSLEIPFVLWLTGEAAPDITAITMPVAFPIVLHGNDSQGHETALRARRPSGGQTGTFHV